LILKVLCDFSESVECAKNNDMRTFKVQQKAPAERKLEKKTFFTSRAIRSNITIDDKTELCCGSRVVVSLLTSSDEWKNKFQSVPIGNGLALFAATFYVHVSLNIFSPRVPATRTRATCQNYIIVRSCWIDGHQKLDTFRAVCPLLLGYLGGKN
jgi:hypothetical protein